MTEQTGVVHSGGGTGGGSESRTPGSASNPVKGKNKKLLYIGGAGIVILLLGHKGSGASGGAGQDPNAQLQSESDALAQAQTDQALAAGASGPLQPGGIAPTTIEGDNSSVTYPASSSTVNLPTGGEDADATAAPAIADKDPSLAKPPAGKKKKPPAHHQPPKHNKPKPAKKSGRVTHPSSGAKVQSHTGATAHGRHFPGARSVQVGGVRNVRGNVYQDVTVDYGGHSETHTSVNGGKSWINNKKGANPPNRGPQHTVTPVLARPAPRPAASKGTPVRAAARPAPRPAPHPAARKPAARKR